MSNIQLLDIKKTYDNKINVIENLSVEINEGEFFVLVGPSGCGKSTLLRMIAGLETISEGSLLIDGIVANELKPKDRNLTMVFQNYALYPHMTVKDNILFGLDIKGVSPSEQALRLRNTSELVGLTKYLDRKPGQLSGGQRQRVALARSICSHSPICLMDEPLSNLDAKLRAQMRIEIKKIQRATGMTLIYVTHDQVEAMTMGDRIMVLDGGHIQQLGTPLELYNSPSNLFVATFIGSPKMNIETATLHPTRTIINRELVIDPISGGEYSGDYIIGIRPENIYPANEKNLGNCKVVVENIEILGNETQIAFLVDDNLFVARWSGQYNLNVGDEIDTFIDSDDLLLFEIGSEKLVRPSINQGGIN